MKVKELVEMLQALDQEREIHLIYDDYIELEIEVVEAEKIDETLIASVKERDYLICAG